MDNFSGFLTFRIDPSLPQDVRKSLDLLLTNFQDAPVEDLAFAYTFPPGRLAVDFISESSLNLIKESPSFKICLLDKNQGLFSYGQNIESSHVDAVLDESLDILQIRKLIEPKVHALIRRQEDALYAVGSKNIRKFEARARVETTKSLDADKGITSENLLAYAQALVDLEKELIHTSDAGRIEKVLKQFVKNHVEKAKFQYFTSADISKIELSTNLLTLPRFKGEFLALEMSWDDADYSRLIKKLFFFYTLVNFFSFKQEIQDPFFDDSLWESVLDSVPFPVALLSHSGEVYQHNTLFSNLNLAPTDCLKYKLREKIQINDIPYNVFRKEVHHLDEAKILFVFFT